MVVDELTIRQGIKQDHQTLVDLLESHQMTSEIDPCEFVVATLTGRLVGAARIEKDKEDIFLRPLVVDSAHYGKGIGRALVSNLTLHHHNLQVVARGSAIGFYQRIGFEVTPWELIPDRFRQECEHCPDVAWCQPSPMRFIER